jgi:hypothetical protein
MKTKSQSTFKGKYILQIIQITSTEPLDLYTAEVRQRACTINRDIYLKKAHP